MLLNHRPTTPPPLLAIFLKKLQCWGKGYYGQTGLEQWQSMGQTDGQMGDSLPTVDLGTSSARRKLGSRGGAGLRGLQAAATTAISVEALSAGGQRSCAILDGGSVKVS